MQPLLVVYRNLSENVETEVSLVGDCVQTEEEKADTIMRTTDRKRGLKQMGARAFLDLLTDDVHGRRNFDGMAFVYYFCDRPPRWKNSRDKAIEVRYLFRGTG